MNIWIKTSNSKNSNQSNSGIRSVNLNLPIINQQKRRYEEAQDTQTQQDFQQNQSVHQFSQQKMIIQSRNTFNYSRYPSKINNRNYQQDRSTSSLQKKTNSSITNKDHFFDNIKKSVRFNFYDSKNTQIQHSKRPYQIQDDLEADTTSIIQSHQFLDGNSKMKFKHIKKQQEENTHQQTSNKIQNISSQKNSLFTFQNSTSSINKPFTSKDSQSQEKIIKQHWSKDALFSNTSLKSSIKPIQRQPKISERNTTHHINTSLRSINNTNLQAFQQQDWNILKSKRQTSIRKTTGRTHIRQHIISIIQYCSNEVGLAIYNTNNGQIYLCQIIERLTYFRTISTIQRFYPLEIIYSNTLEHTPLIKKLNYKFRNISFKNIKRLIFDETKGFNIYTQRGNKQDYNPDNKFIAYSALNALIFYLENNHEIKFNYHSLNIKWHILEDLLIIESQTILELEIFLNAETKNKHNCFIDNFECLTHGGNRMLRANILQPLSNIKAIKERQDLVSILLQDKVLFKILTAEIAKLKNFEIITAKFIQSPKQQNLKSLKSYISSIYTLSHLCLLLKNFHLKVQQYQSKNIPLLSKLISLLSNPKISQLKQTIQQNFDEQILKSFDSSKPTKKQNFIFLFKIQKLDDQFIEIMRITYSHTIQDIFKIYKHIKQHSPTELKLLFNDFRGYYLKSHKPINLHILSQTISDDIIQIQQKKQTLTFSTTILVSLNNRLKQTEKKLILLSQNLLKNIIFHIQKNIDILFEINYDISVMDMLLSFVSFIQKYQNINFTKPTFENHTHHLHIENLKTIWNNQTKFNLTNDINLTINNHQKITILQKQINSFQQLNILYSIPYLTILAQIGCFVPAHTFHTHIYQTILSKITHHENIQTNLSHFQTELYHLKNILDNATHHNNHSLILLNQFVKGTQYQEEISLSLALIKQFLNIKAITFALVSDQFQINIMIKISTIPSLLYESQQEQQPTEEMIKLIKKLPKNTPLLIHQQQISPLHFSFIQTNKNLQQTMNQLNFSRQFIKNFKCLTSEQSSHSSIF